MGDLAAYCSTISSKVILKRDDVRHGRSMWFTRNLITALCAQMLHPDVSGHTVGFLWVGPGRGWVGPFVDARTMNPFIVIGSGLEDVCGFGWGVVGRRDTRGNVKLFPNVFTKKNANNEGTVSPILEQCPDDNNGSQES